MAERVGRCAKQRHSPSRVAFRHDFVFLPFLSLLPFLLSFLVLCLTKECADCLLSRSFFADTLMPQLQRLPTPKSRPHSSSAAGSASATLDADAGYMKRATSERSLRQHEPAVDEMTEEPSTTEFIDADGAFWISVFLLRFDVHSSWNIYFHRKVK